MKKNTQSYDFDSFLNALVNTAIDILTGEDFEEEELEEKELEEEDFEEEDFEEEDFEEEDCDYKCECGCACKHECACREKGEEPNVDLNERLNNGSTLVIEINDMGIRMPLDSIKNLRLYTVDTDGEMVPNSAIRFYV